MATNFPFWLIILLLTLVLVVPLVLTLWLSVVPLVCTKLLSIILLERILDVLLALLWSRWPLLLLLRRRKSWSGCLLRICLLNSRRLAWGLPLIGLILSRLRKSRRNLWFHTILVRNLERRGFLLVLLIITTPHVWWLLSILTISIICLCPSRWFHLLCSIVVVVVGVVEWR